MKSGFRVRQIEQQTDEKTSDSLSGLVPVRVASTGRPVRLVYRRMTIGQTHPAPFKNQCISYLLREGMCAAAEFILGSDLLAVVDLLRKL